MNKDTSAIGAKVQAIIFDCKNPRELAKFYKDLLGGEVKADPYGGFSLSVPGLGISLGFQRDAYYKRPVWLGVEKDQQPMVHLDILVNNRQKAVDYAKSIGALLPEKQFCQPEWDVQWVTLLDPEGHPFCFFDNNDMN